MMTPHEIEMLADAIVQRMSGQTPGDSLLDKHQAAALLRCSVPTIERLVSQKKIPSVKVGRLRRFRRADLLGQVPFPMAKTTVVNLKAGESFDVRIDRKSKWGNPFVIGKDGNRSEVIEKYRQWIANQPELLESLEELRGKRLGCHCKPLDCHGDVLIELLNQNGKGGNR
jgi:excisionase family DNA binding protein